MSGTKDNCSIEHLRKIANQRWPGQYFIKGNEPYDKGVEVIRLGVDPEIVHTFPKNNDAFVAMLDPSWHPGKTDKSTRSLFNLKPASQRDSVQGKRLFYTKLIALKLAVDERLALIDVKPTDSECLNELRYRLRKLKSKL